LKWWILVLGVLGDKFDLRYLYLILCHPFICVNEFRMDKNHVYWCTRLASCVTRLDLISEPAGVERGRTLSRISVAKGSTLNFRGRKSNSLMNLCGKKRSTAATIKLPAFYLYLSLLSQYSTLLSIQLSIYLSATFYWFRMVSSGIFCFDLLLYFGSGIFGGDK